MKKWWIGFVLLQQVLGLNAQNLPDTLYLQEVEINAPRLLQFGLGQNIQKYNADDLEKNSGAGLDDLLTAGSGIFIRSYGAGSLASPSSRGTGFGHTAVLWNGFNLQSPLNGGLDFSLLPLGMSDEIFLQYGGSSALFGGGAIGGVVHLEQKRTPSQGFHGSGGWNGGSFNQWGQQLQLSYSKTNKWSTDWRLLRESAQNDFTFGEGSNRRRQTNAALQQWTLNQHNVLQLSAKQKIHTWLWLQSTDREIPPSSTEANSHAQQRDSSLRLATEWQRLGTRNVQKIRAAWLDERFVYESDVVAPSFTRSQTFIAEAENEYQLSKEQSLLSGLHYTFEKGIAEGIFVGQPQRSRLAAFLAYRRLLARWKTVVNLRQEWVVSTTAPFTASIGLESPAYKVWKLQGHFSRNYKLPTFNDLYWADGTAVGNPNLQAERSWSQDVGVVFDKKRKAHHWMSTVNWFNLWVNDWILWAPQNNGKWQPDNLREVWSRGVEWSGIWQWQKDSWSLETKGSYRWNRATNESIYSGANQVLGKQLMDLPIHTAYAHLSAVYRQTEIRYRHQWTGSRFTTSDNLEKLAAFHLGDLLLQQEIAFLKVKIQIQLRVQNLWNTDYEVLRYRPMPGRSFWLGGKFIF